MCVNFVLWDNCALFEGYMWGCVGCKVYFVCEVYSMKVVVYKLYYVRVVLWGCVVGYLKVVLYVGCMV